MRHNVSTPGGFFVGLGGIVAFCVVSSLVYLWVKAPVPNQELRAQQAALGLAAAPDADRDQVKAKKEETDALLAAAAAKYNAGKKPNIDQLQELRGVVRFREAQKAAEASDKALSAPSNVAGKTVLVAAMEEVANEIAAKKPVASKLPLAEVGPADPKAAPSLPNFMGGGVRTVNFVPPLQTPPAEQPGAPQPGTPEATPPPAATPGAAQPPAPAANPEPAAAPQPQAAAPNRPPLLNSSEPK